MTILERYGEEDIDSPDESRYDLSALDEGSVDSSRWRGLPVEIREPVSGGWLGRFRSGEFIFTVSFDSFPEARFDSVPPRPARVDYRRIEDPDSTRVVFARPGWMTGGRPHLSQRSPVSSTLEQEFSTLAQQWCRETEQLSDAEALILHPAYQRIIGLGKPVLPLIFRALQRDPNHWYWALKMITGVDPVPNSAETMREVREAWLAYGRHHGYL